MPDAITIVSPMRDAKNEETKRTVDINFLSDGQNRVFLKSGDDFEFKKYFLSDNKKADMVIVEVPKDFKSLPVGEKYPSLGVGPEDTVKINSKKGDYKTVTVKLTEKGVTQAIIYRIDFDGDGKNDLEIYQWTPANEVFTKTFADAYYGKKMSLKDADNEAFKAALEYQKETKKGK